MSSENATFRDPVGETRGAMPYGCDFHMHGPPDWRDSLDGKSTENYVAQDYLPGVFRSGRHVIGVPQHGPICTDNNAKLIRDIARRLRADGDHAIPVVYPGYELTSSDQLQLVLLTDPDYQDLRDLDVRVHEALRLGAGNWHESGLTLVQMLKVLRERFHDRLIALAVATGHKGLLEDRELANRNREAYKHAQEWADGFVLGKPVADHDKFVQRVLRGELSDYSEAPAAYVQTSDARALDALGPLNLSHVKLGSFTIEALRQALLNFATFVSPAPFDEPSYQLRSLRVRNTVFFDDVEIEFNPYLNTFVGGRGTGKSCLLEYLAHVCDYRRTGGYDRPNAQILVVRKGSSSEGTLLDGTELIAKVQLGEKWYRIERDCDQSSQIYECADERCEDGVRVEGRSPSTLLNLRFFGQRELANIVRNEAFFTLDPGQRGGANLFSFLRSDQLSQVEEKQRAAQELSDGIQKLSIDIASHVRDLSGRPQLLSERDRLAEDLAKIRRQAADPALQAHDGYMKVASARDGLFNSLKEVADSLRSASVEAEAWKKKLPLVPTDTNTGVEDSLRTIRDAAKGQLDRVRTGLADLLRSWESDTVGLETSSEYEIIEQALSKHGAEYDSAKKKLEEQNINLSLLEPLQKRIQEIAARTAGFNELDTRLTEARAKRLGLVKELRTKRAEQSKVYVDLAQKLTEETRHRVRMKLVRAGDVMAAAMEFQEQLPDKRRFKKDDAAELARLVREAARSREPEVQPADIWTELIDALLTHFETKQDQTLGRTPPESDVPMECSWAGGTFDKLKDLVVGFDDQQMGKLLAQYVPDSVNMELRREVAGDDYIPISQASVGQKATALFLILLSQTDGLLIIDQPEDDLDNEFIAKDILPALKELKHRQQVVFATHNANMLVNAETEKIIALHTERREAPKEDLPVIRGHVLYEGGIDDEKLRTHVTDILEGGRDAFLARERKYRFKAEGI